MLHCKPTDTSIAATPTLRLTQRRQLAAQISKIYVNYHQTRVLVQPQINLNPFGAYGANVIQQQKV